LSHTPSPFKNGASSPFLLNKFMSQINPSRGVAKKIDFFSVDSDNETKRSGNKENVLKK
jgi:hypothetical protein